MRLGGSDQLGRGDSKGAEDSQIPVQEPVGQSFQLASFSSWDDAYGLNVQVQARGSLHVRREGLRGPVVYGRDPDNCVRRARDTVA